MRNTAPLLLAVFFACAPFFVHAQSADGSAGLASSTGDASLATDTASTSSSGGGSAGTSSDPLLLGSAPSAAATTSAVTAASDTPASLGSAPVSVSAPYFSPPLAATSATTSMSASTSSSTTMSLDDTGMSALPSKAPGFDYIPLAIVITIFLLCAIVVFMLWRLLKYQSDEREDDQEDRCDTIKEALDVKKKELEDMIRDWPEEKLKEIAEEKIEGRVIKGKRTKKAVDLYEESREKYEDLERTIRLLEEKWNICLLELPEWQGGGWRGVIVENSLKNKKVLEDFKVMKTSKEADWTVHAVIGDEKGIEKMKDGLAGGAWYALFWKPSTDDLSVVFKGRRFDMRRTDKSTWEPAIAYGASLGIPKNELDFSTP